MSTKKKVIVIVLITVNHMEELLVINFKSTETKEMLNYFATSLVFPSLKSLLFE